MKIIVKVPAVSIANVIGPSGSVLRQLQGISETKIKLKNENEDYAICYINGQKENAELAEKLILDIIANKSPLMKGKKDSVTVEKENYSRYERFSDTINDTMIQVYVSSIANPCHFWLQLITPKACALEHLVDDMTEFYSQEENRKQYALAKVTVGQIIVTKLPTDEKWCRAEVYRIKGKAKDQNPETMIDLFCVDYGDFSYHTLKHLYQIKTEFLSLRFQAIESTMCDIVPKDGSEWSEDSRTAFENMVFTGEWKVMLAQVVDYKRTAKTIRKGCPLPCVRLYDPEDPQGIDIAQKLIKMGLASPAPAPASVITSSPTANVSTVITNGERKDAKKKKGNGGIKQIATTKTGDDDKEMKRNNVNERKEFTVKEAPKKDQVNRKLEGAANASKQKKR
ncbi:tudor and KH domain-containing protein homolog [Cimex lectularius]|uniref:Tudor domain-containing protein n=1 Tax=Cimex lectularius TaxID=79782 RepID=A0A8I6S3Q7_CIMLE|nr:tudor and KH domain-containing protein homolog [Cimex lectularius]XP_014256300.1 tudor and KH domain-containing protein homolog [Cimex lectularius]